MDAGAGRVERELADRNAHAVGAEIAEAEDALAVGDDDEFGLIRPVAQQFRDPPAIVGADEHAARPLEDEAEPLAGKAHGRGVDQRLDFIDIVAHDPEEQRLVAIMQRVKRDIFFQIIGQAAQIDENARDLVLEREHMRGKEAAQPQRVSFRFREGSPLVEQRVAQQSKAARRIGLLRARDGPGWRAHDVSPIGFLLIFGTPRVMAGRGWLTPRPGSSLLVQLLQHLAEFAVESNVDGLKARPRRLSQVGGHESSRRRADVLRDLP